MKTNRLFFNGLFGSIFLLLASFTFSQCATGPGTADGNMGSARLLMQLKPLAADEYLVSQDGLFLNLNHFDIYFNGAALINRHFTFDVIDEFSADLAAGNLMEVLEIDELPGVEYEGVNLILGSGSEADEHDHEETSHETEDHEHEDEGEDEDEDHEHEDHEHEDHEHEADIEEVREEAPSVLIEIEAISEEATCTAVFEFHATDLGFDLKSEGNSFTVTRDTLSSMVILFNQQNFFSKINLGPECRDEHILIIPITDELIDEFIQAFELGESDTEVELEAGEDGHNHG